jgi:hypothetical protein
MAAVPVMLLATFGGSTTPPQALADDVTSDNIDIYVLVDESSSLSERDIQLEREAVQGIVSLQTIKKRGIRVGVVPFSSGVNSPRSLKGCSLLPVDDGNDLILADCARQIRRQFNESGNTDFANAFSYVADIVEEVADDGREPVIILLTDGIYDPDGDRITSDVEDTKLTESLMKLKNQKIPIWALGFGNADLAALDRYARETRQEGGNCEAEANARIAETASLAIQLKVIVGEATCIDVTLPEYTPSKRFVHPLIDTVVVTVVTRDMTKPTVSGPKENDLCPSGFTEISPSTFQCVVAEDGSNAGEWTVDAGPGSLASWEFFGNVLVDFDSCPSPTSLRMSRVDGNPIDFKSAVLWPQFQVTLNDNVLGQVQANQASIELESTVGSLPKQGVLKIQTESGEKQTGLPRLNIRPSSCDLGTEPPPTTTTTTPPTTTIPPTTTVPPLPCDVTNTCPPPPRPWWLFILTILLATGGSFAFLRWRRGRKFPPGTTITQRSPVNERAWIDPVGEVGSDISNLQKFVVVVDRMSKKVSVNSYGGQCDYVISTVGGQIVIESGAVEEASTSDEEDSATSSREKLPARVEPFGLPIALEPGVVIRIERPETDFEAERVVT